MTSGITGAPSREVGKSAGHRRHPVPLTLVGFFEAQVERTPGAPAAEHGGEVVTYAELDASSSQLAHDLARRGVRVDTPVAISMDRSIGLAVAVLGVLKAGGACVPIDPVYPAARREYMLEDSGARWLVRQAQVAGALGNTGLEVVDLARDRARPNGDPIARPDTAADGSALAYVIYTSGSTGHPKGVMLPQCALINLVQWQIERNGFAAGARTLQFSSLSFDVSFQELFATWASGGTVVMIDELTRRDPVALARLLVEKQIQRVFLPFVALRSLADAAVNRGLWPASLREVYTAGEQLQVDGAMRKFFAGLSDCLLENQYGPSETHVVTAHRLEGPPERWPVLPPIGHAVANTVVVVLDANKKEVAAGTPGEIHLGGICLARGYVGKPDLTAERFLQVDLPGHGNIRLYRTGDLAEMGSDGCIQFLGRVDRQIKLRGHRVEPGEVSSMLSAHAGVEQCVVSVSGEAHGEQRLVAYVVPRQKEAFKPSELLGFARANLPAHLVPSHVEILDALPLTPSGKVDVKALPMPTFNRNILDVEFVAPRTADELGLARIWARLLRMPEIGVRDDFFDLGGDSILAANMLEAVRREMGIDLTLGAIASATTIEALAAILRPHSDATRWRCLVPIRTQGKRVPLFCIHGGMAGVASFPLLARRLAPEQPFYGLQWDGLTGDDGAHDIPAMAKRYLDEVRAVQPRGPYLLAGHCIGGLISWEMARQLRAAGEHVAHLFMLDSPNLGSPHYTRGRRDPAWKVILGMKKDRRALAEVWLRRGLGLPVKPAHRLVLAARVMVRAAWLYRPEREQIPATAIMTGLADGRYMNLAGSWDDGAMGWTAWEDCGVSVVKIPAEHSEVVQHPATAEAIERELARQQERLARHAGA